MKYQEYNDYELIYMIGEQNEEASELLLKKYQSMLEIKAKKYYSFAKNKGIDLNDLYQEALIGFMESIKNFKTSREANFNTFANLCVERQLSTAVTKASRQKHNYLNNSLSIDYFQEISNVAILEKDLANQNSNPENIMIDNESTKELYEKIKKDLTKAELEVFELKIKNFNYLEIAKILNKTPKSVTCAISRIKDKIKRLYIIK